MELTEEEKKQKEIDDQIKADADSKKEDTVTFTTYSKVLDKLKNTERDMKEMKSTLDGINTEREEKEKEQLESQGKYKQLNERLQAEVEEANNKNTVIYKRIENTLKIQAFENALPNKLANRDFIKFAKLDEIIMDDPEHVNQASIKMEVDRFVAAYPTLMVIDDDELPPLNPGSRGGQKLLTKLEWESLPLKERKARTQEFIKAEEIRDQQQ